MKYKIKNKTLYATKHIGLILMPIGMILSILNFPSAMTILVISLIMQVLGFEEPYWFFVGEEKV